MLRIYAYYNHEFFKDLPFDAKFIPFLTEKGKYEPWINIALPTKEVFRDRIKEPTKKMFHLHFWIEETLGNERGFGGQINIPLNINSSFLDHINTAAYLWFFFKGQELPFKPGEYQAIFALFDSQTNEIGTWNSFFSIPNFKKSKQGAFINCVLGAMAKNPDKRNESFALNKKNGSLEYGQIKFLPLVTDRFSMWQDGFVFMQVYAPQGQNAVQPEFLVSRKDGQIQSIPGQLAVKSYNKKSKIWSGIYKLDMFPVLVGENIFQVQIPAAKGKIIFSQKIKLTKMRN